MQRYSIREFVTATVQRDEARDMFELESPHLLEVNLDGRIKAKTGAMIGYTGDVNFTREGIMEQGIGTLLKKAVSGEGMTLMKVDGRGRVYLADKGKRVTILALEGETIFVNGNDILAFEDCLESEITMMRRISGMLAGGLFNIRLTGKGRLAMTTHYEPVTLLVTPGAPVFTDPNATVAWSGSLSPEIVTNITLRTLIGRGSGEAIQLKFDGTGWVVLQPYEEAYFQAASV